MSQNFSLIKNEFAASEKRIIPRFPLSRMVFKSEDIADHIFEVRDISYTGMQICLKNGEIKAKVFDELNGELHWNGKTIETKGEVRWARKTRTGYYMGIRFNISNGLAQGMEEFLSITRIAQRMRPLHAEEFELEVPTNLKYWLKSDGPGEIFVWQHRDGELSRFQVVLMDKMIEWQDGKGLFTGVVIKHKDLDTPLRTEEEIQFNIDEEPKKPVLQMALDLIAMIPNEYLSKGAVEFIQQKLKC